MKRKRKQSIISEEEKSKKLDCQEQETILLTLKTLEALKKYMTKIKIFNKEMSFLVCQMIICFICQYKINKSMTPLTKRDGKDVLRERLFK